VNHTTLPDISTKQGDPRPAPPSALVLVLAWSADEPDRAGEVAIIPPGDPGEEVVWGRADAAGPAPHRLLMQRQRPGRSAAASEVRSPKVSRSQLRVQALSARALAVTNAGRATVLHNGEEKVSFEAAPGDVIEVGRQIVLFCTTRPAWLAGARIDDDFPFGAADRHGLVGESPAAWELRRRVAFVAPREGHVLVRGESGTGKELVARALHASSPRAARPLVARNAATLPEGIVDAELFGNCKNYPNPGTPERLGLVGEADGSTLLLDEIAEISPALQSHLLRLLDSGEYHRLGEARARRSDLRLIGATNRPESALKHDLLARFLFRIEVPSLNDRREDIPLLAVHLLRQITARDADVAARFFTGSSPHLSPAFVRLLVQHSYTTHVRELATLLWQALVESPGDRIEAPKGFGERRTAMPEPPGEAPRDAPEASASPADAEAEAALSPAAIQACLDAHNGVIGDAWRQLGLSSRHALARLIKKHGLEIRRKLK
jgi:DNA-binding NtrC family response regulator